MHASIRLYPTIFYLRFFLNGWHFNEAGATYYAYGCMDVCIYVRDESRHEITETAKMLWRLLAITQARACVGVRPVYNQATLVKFVNAIDCLFQTCIESSRTSVGDQC